MKKCLPILFVISAFLPYWRKDLGLRGEQVFSYIVFIIACFYLIHRPYLDKRIQNISCIVCLLLIWIVLTTWLYPLPIRNFKIAFGRIDHYLRPMIILLPLAVFMTRGDNDYQKSMLEKTCLTLIFFLCLNSLIQIVSLFMSVENFLTPFRPLAGIRGFTVAQSARSTGRFVGIFNQPLEHGTACAIGLLAWIYLLKRKKMNLPMQMVSFNLLIFGGFLAFSKVFFIAGIFVSLLLTIWYRLIFSRKQKILILSAILLIALWPKISAVWQRSRSLKSYYLPDLEQTDLLAKYTGRFNKNGGFIVRHFWRAIHEAPLTGIGLAKRNYGDNAYVMTLAEGGLVGLGLLLLLFAKLFQYTHPYLKFSDEAKFLLILLILVLGASMGGPIAGIPRCGTIVWVFIGLLLLNLRTIHLSGYNTSSIL